jgi:hypothetical protein
MYNTTNASQEVARTLILLVTQGIKAIKVTSLQKNTKIYSTNQHDKTQ